MTTATLENDWLLKTGRIGSQVARIFLLSLAVVCGAIGLLAIIAGIVGLLAPEVISNVGDDPLEVREAFGVALMMLTLSIALWLMSRFFFNLSQIVSSVGEGDPFVDENAIRLHAMGMIMLIIFAMSLVAGLGVFAYTGVYDVMVEDLTIHVSLEALFVAILLFILARVFRHGAAMREDLEGTV